MYINFNNEIRKQKEGGAIGMDITGELAKIFMTWWDKQAIQKLRRLEIDPILYKRYVDDINIAAKRVARGSKYENGRLTENEQVNDETNDDTRTFDIIRRVGNEIHSSIQLTKDTPSENPDKKVPILDLKCSIGEIDEGSQKKHVILHEYYMKDVSSKAVIHRDSALPLSSKRTILTQECLRIMMNCNKFIGEDKVAEHLTFFMARMQAAGYDQHFRYQVLKSARNAYNKKQEKDTKGEVPFYRDRKWKRNERRKEKQKKKNEWYKKGGTESILFITSTPESELKNRLQKEIDKTQFKIRVIEKSGTKLVKLLQRNDPFKEKACRNQTDCMVCSGSNPGACRDSGVTYQINCLGKSSDDPETDCGAVYIGETGKNGFTRGKRHLTDYRRKTEESALWKHCTSIHSGEEQDFEMKINDRSRNDPTRRQLLEAVRIQKTPQEKLMNRKNEWNSARLPRARIERFDVR